MKQAIQYSKDWKDKLFINTQAINEIADLPVEINFTDQLDYSITPTTLKKVTFRESLEDSIFIEEYTFKENLVIRFGINISNEKFRESLNKELNIHNRELKEEIFEQESEKITNISGKTNYESFSKHIKLTKCENYVLKEAISYMNANDKKVILIDIFPRESSQNKTTKAPAGRIDLAKLDTHTVLLYKSAEEKILVIDPNNPMFSTHLNKYNDCQIQTLCSTDEKYKIYSRPEGSDTGFFDDKFRDCIDIAVKLGLLLNRDITSHKTIVDIINSHAVKLVTNNSLIDEMGFRIKELIRGKQSSDIKTVESFNIKMKEKAEKIKKDTDIEESSFNQATQYLKECHNLKLNLIMNEKLSFIDGLQHDYNSSLLGNYENQQEL